MLWGRAASRCSLPECRRELVLDPLDTDDPSLVGEAADIVAEQSGGPRGKSDLPHEQRNDPNLILLCSVHHKQVDDQLSYFTVETLTSIKAEHESWVRQTLSGSNGAGYGDTRLFCPINPKTRGTPALPGAPGRSAGEQSGVFLLHGEPGCGKSTLALKFASKVQGAFDAVIFQSCGHRTADEICRIGGSLKLEDVRSGPPEEQLKATQAWLRERLRC